MKADLVRSFDTKHYSFAIKAFAEDGKEILDMNEYMISYQGD